MHLQDPGPSAWKFHLRAETSDPWESCSDTIHFQNEGTPETCPREDHLKTGAGICMVQTWTELCYCWATRRWVLEVHRKLPIWGTNFLQPSTTASCKHHDPASHCATCQSLHGLRGSVPELESTVTPPRTPRMQRLFFRSISNKGHDFMNKAYTGTIFSGQWWKYDNVNMLENPGICIPFGPWTGSTLEIQLAEPGVWFYLVLVAGYRVRYCPVKISRQSQYRPGISQHSLLLIWFSSLPCNSSEYIGMNLHLWY